MRYLNFLIAFVVFSLKYARSANILCVFQVPMYSHQLVYQTLVSALAARGHNLTMMTSHVGLNHPNITEISFESSIQLHDDIYNYIEMKEKKLSRYGTMKKMAKFGEQITEHQLSLPAVENLIAKASTHQFDLIILEYFFFTPFLAFAELFDCPAIGITSMDTSFAIHEYFGNPTNPVLHPDSMIFSFEHSKLNFVERVISFIKHTFFDLIERPKFDFQLMEIVGKHFPNNSATMDQLQERLALMMVNTHPYLFKRPVVPKVVQLGFLHIKPPKQLPEGDIKDFLDESTHGVIYFSFGSSINSKHLSNKTLQMFLNVFSHSKYDILWKYEGDAMPNKPRNVMTRKWMPQADILAHPKVKLMICQGGLQTLEEAIDREVSLLVIPMNEEQEGNALKIIRQKVGRSLDFNKLTEPILEAAIDETLKPEYKENIRKLKRILNDQPMSGLEKAVWWTEHVIRNKGSDHLEYDGRFVPFYQKAWLDILCFLLVLTACLTMLLKVLLRKIMKLKKKKNE